MSTAQLVLTQGAQTRQRVELVPWIVGGIVLIVALWVISKL